MYFSILVQQKFDFRLTVWYNFKAKFVGQHVIDSGVCAQAPEETERAE